MTKSVSDRTGAISLPQPIESVTRVIWAGLQLIGLGANLAHTGLAELPTRPRIVSPKDLRMLPATAKILI